MKKSAEYYKEFDVDLKLNSKNIQKIIDFYLFNCPVPNTSIRLKTFKDYGWNGRNQYKSLKKQLLSAATESLKNNFYQCKDKDAVSKEIQKVSSVAPTDEYCVFLLFDNGHVIESLFKAIRNAIAHGSFNVKTYNKVRVYFFANNDNYLKAEIILTEDTLIKWIDIVKAGYQPRT